MVQYFSVRHEKYYVFFFHFRLLSKHMFYFSDPRVKNWFLMSSPIPTLVMCTLYVLTVKKVGPWLMRDRKPFELRKILIVYNFFQVLFSTWIFYEAWVCGWGTNYSYGCEPLDKSTTPLAMRVSLLTVLMYNHCRWSFLIKTL